MNKKFQSVSQFVLLSKKVDCKINIKTLLNKII